MLDESLWGWGEGSTDDYAQLPGAAEDTNGKSVIISTVRSMDGQGT